VALAEYTAKFDSHTLDTPDDWRISAQDCKAAFDALDPTLRDALETAAKRIAAYHAAQKPENRDYVDETGVRLGGMASGRCGGAVCARRPRGLSLQPVDERDSGQSCRG
jgi:histidinol dehydrogenase